VDNEYILTDLIYSKYTSVKVCVPYRVVISQNLSKKSLERFSLERRLWDKGLTRRDCEIFSACENRFRQRDIERQSRKSRTVSQVSSYLSICLAIRLVILSLSPIPNIVHYNFRKIYTHKKLNFLQISNIYIYLFIQRRVLKLSKAIKVIVSLFLI